MQPISATSAPTTVAPDPNDLPFAPGWVGYLGFETVRELDRVRDPRVRPAARLPLARLQYFPCVVVLDHADGRAWHIGEAPSAADWRARWNQQARAPSAPRAAPPRLRARLTQPIAAYRAMIAEALEYIRAGDIYQVNLAHRIELESIDGAPLDPWALYDALRHRHPAPRGGVIAWPGGAVVSVSPELFLSHQRGLVTTRPIKGTRPRTGDADADARRKAELLASGKEAAELAMIVDLHRNDLGRMCETDTVRVVHPRRVEEHSSVLHTVADITGRLRSDRTPIELLSACFPAGSVSGVPKLRALEIIDELEPEPRGAYCGAIGALGVTGAMSFNVAIRTLQITGARADLWVGGGIVADSDPEQEFAETLAKARGILRALGCEIPDGLNEAEE